MHGFLRVLYATRVIVVPENNGMFVMNTEHAKVSIITTRAVVSDVCARVEEIENCIRVDPNIAKTTSEVYLNRGRVDMRRWMCEVRCRSRWCDGNVFGWLHVQVVLSSS